MTTRARTKTLTKTVLSTKWVQPTAAHVGQRARTPVERWRDAEEIRWAARQWAVRIDAKAPRIQVRSMTTKWASISSAGQITLNANLCDIPKELGEFVIAHEMVQLLVPNQSKAHKGFLNAYLPDWRQRERELRRHEQKAAGQAQGSRHRTRPAPNSSTRSATSPTTDVPFPPVLVVDDEPAQRRLLRELFTLEGRKVHVASHGGTALRRLRASTERTVVLLGLMMPKVDGEAVLEAVAADKALATRHAFIMVTAATGRAQEGRVAELLRQLHIPLVAKPFTVPHIIDAVEEATRQLANN